MAQSIVSGKIGRDFHKSNISNEFCYTQIKYIGNVPWILSIGYKTFCDEDHLTFYLYCDEANYSNLWYCNARVRLQLMAENGKNLTHNFEPRFKLNVRNWRINLIRREEFLDQFNGSVNDNGMFSVVAEIEIIESAGFHKMGIIDFSIPQKIDTEIGIRVGEKMLYFDKCALMCFSPVFREMLATEDFKEIEIKDSNYFHFVKFLRVLNGTQQITFSNFINILTLAKRYDVQPLISNCEDYLISSKAVPIIHKIILSESYQLSRLQEFILENVTTEEIGKEKLDFLMVTIGSQTAKALLVKMFGAETRQNEIKEEEVVKRLKSEPQYRSSYRLRGALNPRRSKRRKIGN